MHNKLDLKIKVNQRSGVIDIHNPTLNRSAEITKRKKGYEIYFNHSDEEILLECDLDEAKFEAVTECLSVTTNKDEALKILSQTGASRLIRAYWLTHQVDEILALIPNDNFLAAMYTEKENDDVLCAYVSSSTIMSVPLEQGSNWEMLVDIYNYCNPKKQLAY